MRKTAHSVEREKIVAEALSPVATELRLIDAADLVSLLRYERWGNISDLVTSAAELYFMPGTVRLGAGGEYRLDWDSKPEILLDLELKPDGVTIYAKLSLAGCPGRRGNQPHHLPSPVGRHRYGHGLPGEDPVGGEIRRDPDASRAQALTKSLSFDQAI